MREYLWGQLLGERKLVTPEDLARAVVERDASIQRGQAATIVQVLVQHRRLDAALMPALARELEARGRACAGCRRAYLAAGPEPAPRCPTCGGPAGLSPAAAPGASTASTTTSGRFAAMPQPPPPRPGGAPASTRSSGAMPAVTLTPPPRSGAAVTPPSSAGPPPTAAGSGLAATAEEGPPAPATGIALGRRFGPYEIVRELGRGGMGVVYQVRRPDAPGPPLALKVLIAGEFASPRLLERFRDEARLAGGLRHPHIVAVHDSGDVDGIPYYAMDFIEGSDLQHLIKSDTLTTRRGIELLAQAARAAHHAHEQGIVHRDLKPSNILVSSAGVAYLMDFGLAKNLEDDKGLTRSGVAIGTPFYMPPEQALGQHRELDARADVYALGAILYEVLARRVPFNAQTQAALTRLIIDTEPTPPSQVRTGVPPELETVCLKALRKAKEDRYASAAALADDLEGWLAGQGVEARREAPWKPLVRQLKRHRTAVAAAAAVLLVVGGMWTMHVREVDALKAANVAAAEREEARRRAEEAARRLAAAGPPREPIEPTATKPPEADPASDGVTRALEAARTQDASEALRLLGEAERLLTEAVGAPPSPDVLYQRALVRRSLCRWADARADFAAAATGPGLRARAHLGRALIELRWTHDRAAAEAALREAAPSALPPGVGNGRDEEATADLIARAYLDHLRGEHEGAQRRLDELRATTKSAMLADVHGARAYLARQAGAPLGGDPRAEQGRAAADEALGAHRWRSLFTLVDRGVLRARAGDVNGALEDLRVSRSLDPESEQPDLLEAVVAARRGEQGKLDAALAAAAVKTVKRPHAGAEVTAFGEALAGARRVAAVTEQVTALVAAGRFREASDALDPLAAADPASKALAALRRAIEGPAQLRVEEALAQLERAPGPASQQALDELLARVPPSVVAAVAPRLEAAARARAGRAAGAVYARRDQALRAGDRAGAAAALEAGLADPALAPARDELARARADLLEVTRAWDAFDASCRALADDLRGRLRLRGSTAPLRGRLIDYDPATLLARHEAPGRREPTPLDLRDVNPTDLAALALPSTDGRANALFFLGRGLPDAARAALDAGGVADAALSAEVDRAVGALLETRVAAALDAALAPGATTETLLSAASGLDQAACATAAYRDRFERLKAAWLGARAAQLEAAPEGLFRGALSAGRRGAVKLRYTFARPDELLDWAPDLTLDPSSGARAGEDGGVIVRGKVAHVAHFQPGELTVELKVTTTNPRQPNINVILGDRGGWTGVLLGNGFMHGTLTSLLVDPTVPRRPTQAIPLPADVVLALDGRAPLTAGPNLFVAPTAASSGARKVEALRDEDGGLRLKVKGRDVARAVGSPGGNAVGAVAFASFATEVLVQEVELVGRLDAAWVTARAQAVATAEAQALPAPR